MSKNIEKKKKITNATLLWQFIKGSKLYFIISIIFALIAAFTDTLNPQIISATLDGVLNNKTENVSAIVEKIIMTIGGYDFVRQNIIYMAILVVSLAIVTGIARYGNRVFNTLGSETFLKNSRDNIFAHIEKLPFSWHRKNKTGDIIQRCTSDIDTINMFVSEQLTSLLRIVMVIGLSLYYMYSMNLTLAIISTAYIPVMIGYCSIYHKLISKRFREADEAEGRVSARIQENLTGVRVVRAFGKERYERDSFWKQNTEYAGLWLKLNKLFTFFWCSCDLLVNIQLFIILAFGSLLCIKEQLSIGTLVAFISYNSMMSWPIRQLGRIIANLSKANVSLSRIKEIIEVDEEEKPANAIKPNLDGDIVFDNVTFGYYENNDILKNVNITIKKGSTIGILGSTGSGKSTIIGLLDKLYKVSPEKGKITINGYDVNDIDTSYLRQNIGIVHQEPFLFSRTIEENIAITQPTIVLDDVKEAARIACLDKTIESFTDGYKTEIGERGVTLSGGQKQRCAIARTLLQKTKIIIFDDSLSAVDTETDSKIRAALKENLSDTTVILISHRITTLMNADKIYVLDNNTIAESGTHAELLDKDGLYKQIFDIQQSGREEGDTV